jgi:DNA-directed RNA polymerase subunit RPC12/RpoP
VEEDDGGLRCSAHGLDTSHLSRRRRIWLWRCKTCGQGYVRHHRGARRYRCADCGGRFQVIAEPEAATSGGAAPRGKEKGASGEPR